ncbi:uncharacterized protein At4g02000-like [Raphanus sativus]|uniref:Uncharacterized protein At4g02000-like n=1 Tax=Raphanus sativus TaxID=3726 RepID=A0A6J0M4P9_RAPSA|nr:uncharacterized protein At4g02000-like [Raphanus sativus]
MDRRYTKAEKGKGLALDPDEPQVKRIKTPALDTTELIRENSLTLIGRVTNPQEQRIQTLLPSLPRKLNIQGRVQGSDLGNNCFQYIFESEEDLQSVLANRPYHFCYWMVLLQRWEPVISNSFPSMIPFWINIKGLPLHYWQAPLVCKIGDELGLRESHELSKSSARVRVLVDGFQPLVKETIIEFESGEESKITLEYERLENHCSICLRLSHLKSQCPLNPPRAGCPEDAKALDPTPHSRVGRTDAYVQSREFFSSRREETETRSTHNDAFYQRVDRHGRAFGPRVSTRQTRNPPPPKHPNQEVTSKLQAPNLEREPHYASPPFTHNRELHVRTVSRGRALFP